MPAKSFTGFGGNSDVLPSAAASYQAPAERKGPFLVFEGASYLRLRLLLSTLTTKAVKIKDIRVSDDNPGLRPFEANFLRLLDKVTNGSKLEINETGTSLSFKPGVLIGGTFDHECNNERGISYYLEPLLLLAPFAKKRMTIKLKGVVSNEVDVAVDTLRSCALPVLRRFLPDDEDLSITVNARGVAPLGGGEVVFTCPVCRTLRPAQIMDQGKIKRIRGLAYALRVSPAMANRVVDVAKGELLKFLPDVYINTDQSRGAKAGRSPGFGVHLVAESNKGCFWAAEGISKPRKFRKDNPSNASGDAFQDSHASGNDEVVSLPEDIGREAAHRLLEEIYRGGCVDSSAQWLAFSLMALTPPDVSKIVIGPLSPYSMECLRIIKQFLGVMFKLEPFDPATKIAPKSAEDTTKSASGDQSKKTEVDMEDDEEELMLGCDKVLATCVGSGFTNLNKTVS